MEIRVEQGEEGEQMEMRVEERGRRMSGYESG
jgi:hypothetical protein